MATETVSTDVNNPESCVLCSTKYNRNQPSLYKCKHCSISLCLNCMKEHHKELIQDFTQILHQYNELQELLQTKQMMIVDETTKSIEHVNQYFDIYINELRDTQQKIIENMERAKQDAQDYLVKIDSSLKLLVIETKGPTKESIVPLAKMRNLSTELKKIEQQLKICQATRTENLVTTKPDFSIKFDCPFIEIETLHSATIEINETCQINPQEPSFTTNILPIGDRSLVVPEYPINQLGETNNDKYESEYFSMSDDDDDTDTNDYHINTAHDVVRMASDGRNILYTSYDVDGLDLIAYRIVDGDDDTAEECQVWNQSRIDDIIWWSSMDKFICATTDGIYTVEYTNKTFTITCIIHGKWQYIRVASNIHELFVWMNDSENDFNGIQIYSTQFEHTRTISFNTRQIGSFVDESTSFCVTDNLIASICTRNRNNREVFQVTFCDMDMNKLNSVLLGGCSGNIEIRTDGKDRFFTTTGLRLFYIVRADGTKQVIKLENDGDCIGVLNNRRIVISNGRDNMELVTY